MPPPKLVHPLQPPRMHSRIGWWRQTALVVASAILLLALILLMFLASQPRPGATETGNATGSGNGQSVSTTSPETSGSGQSATATSAAGPTTQSDIAADQVIPPRPNIEVDDVPLDGISPIDGKGQNSTRTSDIPPGDLGSLDEADRKPRQVVIGNFSSPGVEFFGTRATGNSVAFVVDISGSMASTTTNSGLTNFELMKRELLRSVNSLEPNQTFSVICFNERAHSLQELVNAYATTESKDALKHWLNGFSAEGGTDPLSGMKGALQSSPEVVFLLSDGEFGWDCVNSILTMNQQKCAINTVSLGMDATTLQQIANENGGQFRVVK